MGVLYGPLVFFCHFRSTGLNAMGANDRYNTGKTKERTLLLHGAGPF